MLSRPARPPLPHPLAFLGRARQSHAPLCRSLALARDVHAGRSLHQGRRRCQSAWRRPPPHHHRSAAAVRRHRPWPPLSVRSTSCSHTQPLTLPPARSRILALSSYSHTPHSPQAHRSTRPSLACHALVCFLFCCCSLALRPPAPCALLSLAASRSSRRLLLAHGPSPPISPRTHPRSPRFSLVSLSRATGPVAFSWSITPPVRLGHVHPPCPRSRMSNARHHFAYSPLSLLRSRPSPLPLSLPHTCLSAPCATTHTSPAPPPSAPPLLGLQ